jgi:hypothetical protein
MGRFSLGWIARRALPDFIIIGAMKSGTSSLFTFLSQHPQLIAATRKEVHFFDGGLRPAHDNYAEGPQWYREHFPLKREMGRGQKTFEASPLYLFNPLAPRRIADLVPSVKLIAILRNPTDRAISHYFHETGKGREPLPIMSALLAEEERLRPVLEAGDYKSSAYIHCSYQSRGRYREQLDRYAELFDKGQILVLGAEKFYADPVSSLRQVCRFIGVNENFTPDDLRTRNVSANRSEVEPEVAEHLDRYFEAHNRALHELVGEDFGW